MEHCTGGRVPEGCRPDSAVPEALPEKGDELLPVSGWKSLQKGAFLFEPCDGKACMALSCRVDPGDLVLHSVLEEGFLYFEDGIPGVVTINGFYLTVEGTEEKSGCRAGQKNHQGAQKAVFAFHCGSPSFPVSGVSGLLFWL
jgi:hypothetical protein